MRRWLGGLATLMTLPALAAGCDDALFVDAIAESAWVTIDIGPAGGTAGLREAIRQAQAQHPAQPVRVRLAPGTYADNLGGEVYAQRLLRTAAAPLALVAADPTPQATILGQGLNFVGVAYLAIDGLTVGPPAVGAWNGQQHADPQPLQAAAGIHVAGAALAARTSARTPQGTLDWSVYGRYDPSHHVVVRRVTVQNLFGPDEPDGETSASQNMDGMKFNQVEDLWVLDSTVRQTTRHGIDNVGVHRAAFCRNVVAQTGGGLGLEAKGGSVDVLVDSNTFYRVRRVELGGEETDATYYFSADGRWDYEALRTVVRNNLIVDAREAALEWSGCIDCAAVGNTIVFTTGYEPPRDGDTLYGGDAMRMHASRVLGADDGAGSECIFWDEQSQDYVAVDPCWGVGARRPAPVDQVLATANAVVVGNVFSAEAAQLGAGGGSVVPCPLNATGEPVGVQLDGNYWWNGGQPLPVEGCTLLPEGARSRLPGAGASLPPLAGGVPDTASFGRLASSLMALALPRAGSPVFDMEAAHAAQAPYDRLGAPRAAAAGAITGSQTTAERLFNFAERYYTQFFAGHATSTDGWGYHYRYYPATATYIAAANGRLYLLGPALTGNEVVDYGALGAWLPTAAQAGF